MNMYFNYNYYYKEWIFIISILDFWTRNMAKKVVRILKYLGGSILMSAIYFEIYQIIRWIIEGQKNEKEWMISRLIDE